MLVLTPALVAGVIADEKQRKTLHYLMASRLNSAEIVLGKLLVRMLYVSRSARRQLAGLEPAGAHGGRRPAIWCCFLWGDTQHGLVSGITFDLGLNDRQAGFARHFSLPSDWSASGYSRRSS